MTLLDCLARNAREIGSRTACIVLDAQGDEVRRLDWAAYAASVQQTARALRAHAAPGAAVILPAETDGAFGIAFLACVAAGLVGVPLPGLDEGRAEAQTAFVRRVAADASAAVILASGRSLAVLQAQTALADAFAVVPVTLVAEPTETVTFDAVDPRAVVGLLYTSGSTSAPKGVVLGHHHLAYNARSCCDAWAIDAQSVLVSWMPHHHSFGLIYNVLLPLYRGAVLVATPPETFVARPRLWFEMIHRYRGTHAAAATFGYRLCTQRIDPAGCSDLDLSCWRVALISAEPVRRGVCREFMTRFQPLGLHPDLLCALYGLSECGPITSMAAGEPLVFHDDPNVPEDLAPVRLGPALPESAVWVVDAAGRRLPPGEVGEVWLAGPSVMAGYHARDAVNREVFACPVGADRAFFRTGDQGFMDANGLYITGRLKEIIIVRGKNVHPQDLEWAAMQAHPAAEGMAAAGFEAGDGACCLVVEAPPLADARAAAEAMAASVARHLGLSPDRLYFAAPGTIPRTGSGKLRRAACAQAVADGTLGAWFVRDACADAPVTGDDFYALAAAAFGMDPDDLDPDDALSAYDLDSLAVMTLVGAVQERLGVALHPTAFYKYETLAELAAHVDARRGG